jgi:arylsulfatase A-like enzyme
MRNPQKLLLLALLLCPAWLAAAESAKSAPTKPNIILIYSDDHGYADLGAQGTDPDIRTPNLDALVQNGVRFSRGYVSAPQCVPSRAGVLTGRYQQRFGVEDNGKGPVRASELTIAERLKPAGYTSCQIGKWHLAGTIRKPDQMKPELLALYPGAQGFDEYYTGAMDFYVASHDLKGNNYPDAPKLVTDSRFRTIWQTDAAISFIDRHSKAPFFMYLAYFVPHVPMQSPEPWFSKTPKDLPIDRRQALAMIAAMDEGIGQIRAKLRAQGIEKNTLIFFVGDNGAPLNSWDGSLNTPLVGEKGMLTDGGIRTPFVAEWPGTLPAGKVYDAPVINLDIASTAVALAGLPHDPVLDGVNLIPFVKGEKKGSPHDALFWRWRSQAAVRDDHWKLILVGEKEKFLFDMNAPDGESELAKNNMIGKHPEIAAALEKKLMTWNATLPPPGLPREIEKPDQSHYDSHVREIGPTRKNGVPAASKKGKKGEVGGGD